MTEGQHGSSRARPVIKTLFYEIAETWGFYYWSLGVYGELAARARCLICQALFIHRLWVTTGVWEFVGFCQVN